MPTALRLSGPADLVAAVPSLLNFHPTESVVLMALSQGRLALTMRIDLDGAVAGLTGALPRLHELQVTDLALLIYPPDGEPPRGWNATSAYLQIRGVCERAGINLLDALQVSCDRFYSLMCEQQRCCPVEGMPLSTSEAVQTLQVQGAVSGRRPLGSREEIAASLRPAGQQVPPSKVLDASAALSALIALREAPGSQRRPEHRRPHLASVLAAACDVPARDELLMSILRAGDGFFVAELTEVVTVAGPQQREAALTLLAVLAYCSGDGALALVALDAMREPTSLARLLDKAISSTVPPAKLIAVLGQRPQ